MSAVFPSLNPTDFKSKYKMYVDISDDTLQNLWVSVELNAPKFLFNYSQNTANHYFYIILAHYCELWQTRQAGRVVSATAKDVSTNFEVMDMPTLQWWATTNWGNEISQLIRRRGGAFYVS